MSAGALYFKKLHSGSRLILAPMAGITDLPFRMLNRQHGAELCFVEMINARSLGYNSRKTQRMLATEKGDAPLGVQLLGCEPDFIVRALDVLRRFRFELLDFNAACPVKKVVRRGEGAALLKDPVRLGHLLRLVVKGSGVPVTVKIRTGWDGGSVNAREIGMCCEDAGACALFIHGRTRMQFYGGEVDYDAIRAVKKAVHIPVIGSGNVLSPQLAKRMLDETGCDAVLVARGALGDPWIFRRIEAYLTTGALLPLPAAEAVASTMRQHLAASIAFHGLRKGVSLFHKFFGWYTRGFRRVRPLRETASRCKTEEQMLKVIAEVAALKRHGPSS